ncbi:hypothetical protein [Nitrosococcus watsonii]|uniref:Glutathionylspermidine synthase pre-ATP-grasp-like domain-containing protein n=1 Tax=Nitrosococcus watsoni (strain C-113) TaxID=105559 RepID=D8KA74_NITWC|nr:hypothetical protein [Nitrosococcus watsonii]ADJ27389.1 conserved hypothetical protein [Nitrosococcus watsonii C-113]
MPTQKEQLFAALEKAGVPPVPHEFSVVPWHQFISSKTMAEIRNFIKVFERVTTRLEWQKSVTTVAPEIARHQRAEVCFFSAWDFHLPPDQDWQVIEFNDNGSGLLFAGLMNDLYYQIFNLSQDTALQLPPTYIELIGQIIRYVKQEAKEFFEHWPQGLFLILEEVEALQKGKFRNELFLLRDIFCHQGWKAAIASPEQLYWDGRRLHWEGQEVSFIVNRSTDFLWQGKIFSPLRAAYEADQVYVAPNPFTYATRSDKRLLERLSLSVWDQELGIQPEERAVLSSHIPETHWLRPENVEELAHRKEEFIFKPAQGFAARGLLASTQVGRSRLRRLLKEGAGYVAQKKIPKSRLRGENPENSELWTDLRVWAYRGEILLLSGRASSSPDKLDLSPPGGWLPTYVQQV